MAVVLVAVHGGDFGHASRRSTRTRDKNLNLLEANELIETVQVSMWLNIHKLSLKLLC